MKVISYAVVAVIGFMVLATAIGWMAGISPDPNPRQLISKDVELPR
jgi:hypothetical protein